MLTTPRLENRDEQPYVAIAAQVAMKDIPTVLPPLIPQVLAWVRQHEVQPAGDVFFRYLRFENGKLDAEVGVPVGAVVAGDDYVRPGTLPAGRYAKATYMGHYNSLPSAWSALEKWREEHGLKEQGWTGEDGVQRGTRVEAYVTDPAEEPNPENWVTEISLMVTDGSAA